MFPKKYTVLYIEDNEMNRKLMRLLCSDNNISLLMASNGVKGLALAKEKLPDLIFTDIGLPDIDGYEILARLKQEQATTHIPVVAVSGDQLKDFERDTPQFDRYLAKPFKMDSFHSILNQFLKS